MKNVTRLIIILAIITCTLIAGSLFLYQKNESVDKNQDSIDNNQPLEDDYADNQPNIKQQNLPGF